jgi:tetratricopeptide (TPR) repeat protein/DNA-binding MarR family transcriptional regulator/GTPase SAR1 family protein
MPTPEKLSITIDNKILLHILAIGHLDIKEEIPITLTQSGIAEAIETPLGSVSRALKKLIDKGFLVEKLYHVRGKKRRMSAYFLTLSGEKFIINYEEVLVKKVIKYKPEKGDFQFISMSEAIKKLGKKPKMIDILNHILPQGYIDRSQFLQEIEAKTKSAGELGLLVKHVERMPKIKQFFDRTKEQNYLIKNMKSSKIVVIHGMAGIGKSTLAAKFIENYFDTKNVYWYRFQEWDTVRNILIPIAGFLSEMDRKKLQYYIESTPKIDFFEVINILANDLNKSNSIIVFDDFQRVGERIIQFFSSLVEHLEKIENIFIVILSRSLIRFYDRREVTLKNLIKEIRLDGLDREGSRELVKTKDFDKTGFNRIYDLTKGHPLALELLESIDDVKHPTKNIMRFVHEEIFSKLGQDEKDLLKAISVYRGPAHSDAIFMDAEMEYETLDKLIEKSLITEIEPSLYEIHDIIREFFYSRLTPSKRIEYHSKAANYYQQKDDDLTFIETAYHLIQSNAQEEAAKLIIDQAPIVIDKGYHEEIMNILMSFDYNLETKYLSQIYRLKGQILDIWGEWDNIFEYYYQCYTISKYLDKYQPFNLDREQLHNTVGFMSWKPLEVKTALENLKSSLNVVKEVEDKTGENEIIRSLGWVSWLKGDYKNAISHYKKSLDGLKKLPIEVQEIKANILINLGNIYWERSEWDKSIEYFRESVEIFKELKNNYKVARIFNNIGCVFAEKGDLDKALNFFNKGIKLSDEIYYIRGKAYTLLHHGEVQLRLKQFVDAQKTLERALEIFSKIEDHLGIAYSKICIGLINFFHQNWYKAKDHFQGCVNILMDTDTGFYLGEIYLGLSIIHSNLNNLSLMKEFRKNADNTFRNIKKFDAN